MSAPHNCIPDIPAYIFGEQSRIALHEAPAAVVEQLEGSPLWFNVTIFALLALYILWLNYWSMRSDNHRSIFKFLGYHRGDVEAKLQYITPSMKGYLNSTILLGVVAQTIAAVSLLESEQLSNHYFCLFTLALSASVLAYQMLIINIIGHIAGESKMAAMLLYVKRICYAILTIVVTPIILCYAISSSASQLPLMYLTILGVSIVALILIYETFLLFIRKKVSVLHTILYLCTVEIFPFTLIWGFFYR
ncbi:MAG: DUF4271 domain-containing protein [Rikenellaceae bacterium]